MHLLPDVFKLKLFNSIHSYKHNPNAIFNAFVSSSALLNQIVLSVPLFARHRIRTVKLFGVK